VEGWRQGSVRYLKSARAEAAIKGVWEGICWKPLWKHHVPKALHIDQIKPCLIRDNLQIRAHLSSKGHFLTPALMEIWWTRAERLLHWHIENGHENIFFTDDKIPTIEDQYNNQNNKIYAQTSLEVSSECTGSPSHFLLHGTVSHQGLFISARKG
jgi:hypothetical protein